MYRLWIMRGILTDLCGRITLLFAYMPLLQSVTGRASFQLPSHSSHQRLPKLMVLNLKDLPAFANSDESVPMPQFIPTVRNITYHRGETAILQCSVKNLGTKTVMWRKASDPHPWTIGTFTFVKDSSVSVSHIQGSIEWNLLIKNVQKRHGGVYVCQISTRDRISQPVLLRINGTAKRPLPEVHSKESPIKKNPKPSIMVSGTTYIEKGDPIHLMCNATSTDYPPQDVDWFKDGNKISSDTFSEVYITKYPVLATKTLTSTLEIKHSKMADAGEYVCRSSNFDVTSIKVHVLNGRVHTVGRSSKEENIDEALPVSYLPSEANLTGTNNVKRGTSAQGTKHSGCDSFGLYHHHGLLSTILLMLLFIDNQ